MRVNLRSFHWVLRALPIALVVGCAEDGDVLGRQNVPIDPGADSGVDEQAANPACSEARTGRSYLGLSGEELTATRVNAEQGVDRARIKPHAVLGAEYARTVGVTPPSVAGNAATFGAAPVRWYEEPKASAVSVSTYFTMGFEACLEKTKTAPELADAPNETSAATQCAAMARRFWGRSASQEEVRACVQVATVDSAAEPLAFRRWAYACASLLAASGFVAY
jgi:hypothetical protein